MKPTQFRIVLLLANLLIFNNLRAQQFYNYEEFFNDSAYILSHFIKTVTMRIPALENDTTNDDIIPFQKLCYNPYGKLGQYEFNLARSRQQPRGFVEHHYGDDARCFKSLRYQRNEKNLDSLREVTVYSYDETGKLFFEEHHQIWISEFNEWTCGYEFIGDSLRVKYSHDEKVDSFKLDLTGKLVEFTRDGWRFRLTFDPSTGKKTRMTRFFLDNKAAAGVEVADYNYVYGDDGNVARIEMTGREVMFLYDDRGLPISSFLRERASGKMLGYQIFYDYEFR